MIDQFKDRTLFFLQELGLTCILFWDTVKGIYRKDYNVKNIVEQLAKIGVDSLPVALITAVFVGMVFAVQIANEFVKFGAGQMVGGVMAIAVARELAPALTGVVLAARVGAAIAAEIGTMKVTEQIDALKALGSNPIRYLVIPRFIACSIMLPILTILADIIGFFGGYLVAVYLIQINAFSYLDTAQRLVSTSDVMFGLIKTVFFGMIIAIVASYKGLNAKNGAKGVGEATTSAVVTSLICIFIANYFLSLLFFK